MMRDQTVRLYTAEQVRGLDKCAIEGHGIAGMELMENAGRCAFDLAREQHPSAGNYLVLCGGGNNGGDGYIVARLALEAGLQATVCALKDPAGLRGDAATAATRWLGAGGEVLPWPVADSVSFDLVFDALLGTGLDREPAGSYGDAVDFINRCGRPVIAVDIPSGLNADSGVVMGRAVRAQHTTTFIGRKRGLYTADGPDVAGKVIFSDLQTPQSVADSEPDYGILIEESLIHQRLPQRQRNSHKGSFGWVLAVGGNHGMSGAVRLAGEAALRSGAGKVTVATRSDHASLINLGCPELMVRGVESGQQLDGLVEDVSVVVTGTGLGQTTWSGAMLSYCLEAGRPLVIDADGLNLLAKDFQRTRLPPAVLTPHPAEAARMLGSSARDVQADRVAAAGELASLYGAIVVLKGCGTVIAESSGRYAICPYGNPGMATAGSGDVLAGVIAAMVAQGLDLWDASLTGVLAHALAGDRAASQLGERGLLASDITAQLPCVLNPR
ncbi:MAG: NAD(P)H-hydrate dehydratase [Xanthomonadales bacterium]|nr:NAD(P)H-hydrate dehydratase [Xanthomonadales bacterium]